MKNTKALLKETLANEGETYSGPEDLAVADDENDGRNALLSFKVDLLIFVFKIIFSNAPRVKTKRCY